MTKRFEIELGEANLIGDETKGVSGDPQANLTSAGTGRCLMGDSPPQDDEEGWF